VEIDNSGVSSNPVCVLQTSANAASYIRTYRGSGGNFHGTTLPQTNNNWYWFVFTYQFNDVDQYDFSMNDIHSPTNNINNVYGYGRYENGVWTPENTGIAYIIYNSESNLPEINQDPENDHTQYDDNGAWNIPSDMNPIPPTVTNSDYMRIIREDDEGNRFFYVWAVGQNVNTEKAVLKVMLLSDGTLDILNDAMENDNESSLTVADYENIQVTGVTSANLNAVNTALAGVNEADLPLTVSQIQTLVNSTLAVDEQKVSEFGMYPNPANDIVNIEVGDGKKLLNVEVFNVVGKKVLSFGQNQLSNKVVKSINVNSLIGGIYMMVITTERGSSVKKLVIKH
jgi:hypothetical protein